MTKKAVAKKPATPGKPRKATGKAAPAASHRGWPAAGLGALAKAQHEGVKVFETLLKQGQRLERKTKQAAVDTAVAARGVASAKAKEMQQMAGGTWDKLEQVFEERVARALSKLGIYTQNDIERLVKRVDELSEAVNRLLQAKGATPTPARARTKVSATAKRKNGAKAARR